MTTIGCQKRIAKNSKRIPSIAATLHKVYVYNLDNYFHGQEYAPNDMYAIKRHGSALAWIQTELQARAKLYEVGVGMYCLHIHSNLWFDLVTTEGEQQP